MEKFKTAEDVGEWLEERGFPREIVEAFVGKFITKLLANFI
jgi:hypothetical protein